MEHPLSRSASWLNSVLEASLSGVLAFEPLPGASGEPAEYRATFANRAAGELIGTVPDLVVGNTLGNLFPNDAVLRVYFDWVVARGEAQRFEFEHLNPARPGAGRTWFDASVNRLDGGVVMSFIDVTATRQVESQAEKTIARLHCILDGSPAAIGLLEAVRDADGRLSDFTIVSLNEQFCTLMKYQAADLIGRRFRKLFRRSLTARLYDRFVRVVETGVPLHEELHFERGPLRGWFDLTAVRQGDGLTITVLDVTAYREAEAKARQTAFMLETVLDRAQAGVTWHHAVRNEAGDIEDFRVVAINEASAELFARVNPDLRGRALTGWRLSNFFPQAWDLGLFDRFVNVVETGEAVRYERTYPTNEGEAWFDVSAVKQDDGLILTFVDITRSKEAELEAEATAELLGGVFDASPWAIVYLSPQYDDEGDVVDLVFQMANARSEEVGGQPIEHLLGRGMLELYPRTREIGLFEEYRRVLETGKPFDREVFYDGEGIARWSHITAVRQGDGLVLTNSDVTARKLAELENEESLRMLQGVLASAPAAIAWLEAVRDAGGRVADFVVGLFNAQAAGMARRAGAELHAHRLRELFPHVEDAGFFADCVRVVETGQPLRRDVFYEWDGIHGWFDVQAARHGDGVVVQALDVTERKKAEAEVLRLKDELAQRAEDRYQTLFTAMDQGFCLLEAVETAAGAAAGAAGAQPGDFRYLTTNPAFERHTGLRDVVGKTIREVVPDAEPELLDAYAEVARTGRHRHLEAYVAALDLWLAAEVFPAPEPGQIAVLFTNVTGRKKDEERLRRAAGLDAFRVKLADALRPLADPREIQRTAIRVLGEQLKVDRTLYAEVEPDDAHFVIADNHVRGSFPKMTGRFSLRDFGRTPNSQRAGETLVLPDIRGAGESDEHLAAYLAAGVRAIIGVPLNKKGRWVASLTVHHGSPRQWTPEEAALVRETAERTWAAVEKARAEEALRESEARFRGTFEQARVGIVQATLEGRVLAANPGFCHLLGYTDEEVRTLTVRDISHPDDYEPDMALVRRVIAGEMPGYTLEKRYVRKSGETIWVQLTSSLVRDAAGQPGYAMAVVEDITERKQAETALRQSEERLRLAIAAAEMGTWEWYLNTNEVYWNEQHFTQFGMEPRPNPVAPDEFFRHVHPDDRDRVERQLRRAIAERSVFDVEFRAVPETGETRWMNGYGRVTEEVAGQPARMSGVMLDITERKRAEEQLRDFAARLEQQVAERTAELVKNLTLLQQTEAVAEMGSWSYSPATGSTPGVFEWSEGMYRLFGLEPGAPVQPETYLAFTVGADQSVAARIVDFLKHPNGHELEEQFRIQTTEGEKTVRIKATVQRNAVGEPERVLGVDIDITAQVQAERQLAATAETLRTILDAAQAGIALLKAVREPDGTGPIADFVVLSVNHLAAELNGIPVEHTLGRRCSELFPHYKTTGLFDRYVGVVETGQKQRFEARNEGFGPVEWFDVSLGKHDDGLVVTFSDISRLKRLQLQHHAQATMLEGILDSSANSVGVYDALRDEQGQIVDFRVRLFNPAALQSAGLRWADVEGKTLLQLSPYSKEIGIFHAAVEVVETGQSQQLTRDYPHLGKSFSIALSRFNADGLIVGSVDITELRQTQRQQEELLDELRKSNLNLEQFAYVTSHDLQEPLRKIQSFGAMLEKRLHGRLEPTETDLIRRMQDAANRMKALIEDLLTFSRLTAKKDAFRLLNLDRLAREVLNDLESTIQEKNARVHVGPLPRLKGDAMQWRQLLQNLMSNALKFSRPGVVPEVRLEARAVSHADCPDATGLRASQTYWEITVADNGIGFDDQYREKIFDMFQRLHGRAEYSGTGIGLAIARKVAEQHGGCVSAHGVPGQGATFRVYVPAVGQPGG